MSTNMLIDEKRSKQYMRDEELVSNYLNELDTYYFSIDDKKLKTFYNKLPSFDLKSGLLQTVSNYINLHNDNVKHKFYILNHNSRFGPIISSLSVPGFYQYHGVIKDEMLNLFMDNNCYYINFTAPELYFLAQYSQDEKLIKDLNKFKVVGSFWDHMRDTYKEIYVSSICKNDKEDCVISDDHKLRTACKMGLMSLVYNTDVYDAYEIGRKIWKTLYPNTVAFVDTFNSLELNEIQDMFGNKCVIDNYHTVFSGRRNLSILIKSSFDSFHIKFLKQLFECCQFNIRLPFRDNIIVDIKDMTHKDAKKLLTALVNNVIEEYKPSKLKMKFVNIEANII